MGNLLRSRTVLALTLVAGVASLGSLALASIPGPGGVISACYGRAAGSLRVIDASTDTCRPSEVALDWNREGVAGAPGATGPAGPAGPTGATGLAGADGVSGYQIVGAFTARDTESPKQLDVSCPAGKKAVGSGYDIFGLDVHAAEVTLTTNAPSSDGTSWRFIALEGSDIDPVFGDWELDAWVICVTA